MKCNRLALSISKTNFILFHSSKLKPNQSLRIKIDDTPIKQVDSTKYLGITFDSNLTWKSHINELCLKLSKTVGILSKVRHFVNKHILVILSLCSNLSIYLSSMMLLNYKLSLLSINGHIDCYPPVSVNILNLHPLFIPIQQGNRPREIFI